MAFAGGQQDIAGFVTQCQYAAADEVGAVIAGAGVQLAAQLFARRRKSLALTVLKVAMPPSVPALPIPPVVPLSMVTPDSSSESMYMVPLRWPWPLFENSAACRRCSCSPGRSLVCRGC
ncbi:hypothetical protein M5585_26345 [Serratia ureilytica]